MGAYSPRHHKKGYPPFLPLFLLNSAKMADVFCLSAIFFVFLQSFRAIVRCGHECWLQALASDNEKIIKKHYNERFIQMA